MGVQAARIGQHPEARFPDGFRLKSERGFRLGERRPVSADAEHGEKPGSVASYFGLQLPAAFDVLRGRQFGGRGGRALDDVGDAVAAREQGLLRLEGKEYVMQEGDVVHFRLNV